MMPSLLLLIGVLTASVQDPPDPLQGLWRPVDLEEKKTPTADAFKRLLFKAGLPAELPDELPDHLAEKPLSVSLQGVSFWKAADELLRQNGGMRYGLLNPLPLEVGPWRERPAVYQGPFRISIYDVARVRELRYPARLDHTDVTIAVQWMPDLRLARNADREAGTVKLLRVTDDGGKSLLPPVDFGKEYDFPGVDAQDLQTRWLFRLSPASKGAKRIARIEGEWTGAALTDQERFRFEKPAEHVGQTRKAGPLAVTLTECKRNESVLQRLDRWYTVRFTVKLDPKEAGADWKAGLAEVPLGSRLTSDSWGGQSGDPSEIPLYWIEDHAKTDEAQFWGTLHGVDDGPKEVVVRLCKSFRRLRIPFAFDPVALPEEGP